MVIQKQPGEIVAVCVSDRKGVRKKNVGEARLQPDWGIEEDAHSGTGHRQISLLAAESMAKLERALSRQSPGSDYPPFAPGDFAENLTTRGIELHTIPVGALLRIGSEVVLRVTQIGKECHDGCAIRKLSGDCIMPREGIFARVVEGGGVAVGDVIEVVKDERGRRNLDEGVME
ncbi:MAG: MOSC domain-containing protein [PVC group bacterium]